MHNDNLDWNKPYLVEKATILSKGTEPTGTWTHLCIPRREQILI